MSDVFSLTSVALCLLVCYTFGYHAAEMDDRSSNVNKRGSLKRFKLKFILVSLF